jgi:hypothetical protein
MPPTALERWAWRHYRLGHTYVVMDEEGYADCSCGETFPDHREDP